MSESQRTGRSTRNTEAVQRNQPPSDDHSPPELDEAVLRAARRAVRFHRLTRWLEKADLSPATGWQLLAGMTLGAAICAGLDLLLGDDSDPIAPGMIRAGEPPWSGSRGDVDERRVPEFWLRHIAALIGDGRVAEAEAELQAFRKDYPDYAGTKRQNPLPRVP
jgi:hypothetical protein